MENLQMVSSLFDSVCVSGCLLRIIRIILSGVHVHKQLAILHL